MTDRPVISDAERSKHYSYTFYADATNARAFDGRRFGGPIGELVAEGQAHVLVKFLGEAAGRSVLDVGTGTGRAAFLMADCGAHVTGVDASEEMLAVARERARERTDQVEFAVGDAHALSFPDQSFDTAVSLRVLMHTPRWRVCVDELCRVSRHTVVLDYPSICSVALLQSMVRKLRHAAGGHTEPYRVFADVQIATQLARSGFRVTAVHRQFVLPIALHKALGSRAFTEGAEQALSLVGLRHVFGSPVTILAQRCVPS